MLLNYRYFHVIGNNIKRFLLSRLVPESVRWLLAKKKNRKAGKIIKKAAKINKVVLSQQLVSAFDEDDSAKAEEVSIDYLVTKFWNSFTKTR